MGSGGGGAPQGGSGAARGGGSAGRRAAEARGTGPSGRRWPDAGPSEHGPFSRRKRVSDRGKEKKKEGGPTYQGYGGVGRN